MFASRPVLICLSVPLQEKGRIYSSLHLLYLSSTRVSLSGGVVALQGGKMGVCYWGNAFSARGGPSLQHRLEVLCGDPLYLLFSRSSFCVSLIDAMGGSAVADCLGWLCWGAPLWWTWRQLSSPPSCRQPRGRQRLREKLGRGRRESRFRRGLWHMACRQITALPFLFHLVAAKEHQTGRREPARSGGGFFFFFL